LTICLLLASGLKILNDCDQVCNYFLHYFQHFQVVILCSFYLKQRTATRLWFFPLISMDTTKIKYLQTIGMHRMFLNVATFSVTNRSISSQTEIDSLLTLNTYVLRCSANFGAPSIIYKGVHIFNVPKFYLRGCGTTKKTKSNSKNCTYHKKLNVVSFFDRIFKIFFPGSTRT
jgi:hypothetical protein